MQGSWHALRDMISGQCCEQHAGGQGHAGVKGVIVPCPSGPVAQARADAGCLLVGHTDAVPAFITLLMHGRKQELCGFLMALATPPQGEGIILKHGSSQMFK